MKIPYVWNQEQFWHQVIENLSNSSLSNKIIQLSQEVGHCNAGKVAQ